MSRFVSVLLIAAMFGLSACESTPKRNDPEPEPGPREYPKPEPQPEPAPLPPELNKAQPPERPWKAPDRERLSDGGVPQPTFADFLDKTVAPWRNNLSPAFVPGQPHAMQNVQTSNSWSNGKATLKVESTALSTGGWKANGYGEATYNSNGALYAKAYFRDGKPHGPAIYYNEDGSLKSIECYKNGLREGPYAGFTDGKITTTGLYTSGFATGEWRGWTDGYLSSQAEYRYANGISLREWAKTYDKDGWLATYQKYANNERIGSQICWVEPKLDDDGKVTNASSVGRLELQYYDDENKTHGWQSIYHAKVGYRIFDTWYEHGVQTGPILKYNPEGKKIRQGQNTAGIETGRWKDWTDNGSVYEYGYGPKGPDGGKQGKYICRDANGKITTSGAYKDGKPVGEWVVEVGRIKTTSHYNDKGMLDGKYTTTSDGEVIADGQYQDGKRTGHWKTRDGASYAIPNWSIDGNLIGEGEYDASGRIGEWTWNSNGTVVASGAYNANKKTGAWKYYNLNGSLGATGVFANGLLRGPWDTYDDDGNRISTTVFKSNLLDGPFTEYFADGTVRRSGAYAVVNGSSHKVGNWDEYNEAGELTVRESYSDEGDYRGKFVRESALENTPEGVVIDPKLQNGVWLAYPVGTSNYTQRSRMVNGEIDGKFEQFYPGGTLGAEGEIHNNAREGEWKFYHPNGTLKEVANFLTNTPNGAYSKYREDGTLNESGEYTNGKKSGSWKLYHTDGQQTLSEINHNADGEYQGAYRTWNAAGQMLSETFYASGKRHGTDSHWYDDGQKKWEMNYTDGKRDGLYTQWYANGQVKSEASYKASVSVGTWKGWYENGQQQYEHSYNENGDRSGTWTEWNEDGSEKSKQTYAAKTEKHETPPDKKD